MRLFVATAAPPKGRAQHVLSLRPRLPLCGGASGQKPIQHNIVFSFAMIDVRRPGGFQRTGTRKEGVAKLGRPVIYNSFWCPLLIVTLEGISCSIFQPAPTHCPPLRKIAKSSFIFLQHGQASVSVHLSMKPTHLILVVSLTLTIVSAAQAQRPKRTVVVTPPSPPPSNVVETSPR